MNYIIDLIRRVQESPNYKRIYGTQFLLPKENLFIFFYNNPLPFEMELNKSRIDLEIRVYGDNFIISDYMGEIRTDSYDYVIMKVNDVLEDIPITRKLIMENWIRKNKRSLIAAIDRTLENRGSRKRSLTREELNWLYGIEKKILC